MLRAKREATVEGVMVRVLRDGFFCQLRDKRMEKRLEVAMRGSGSEPIRGREEGTDDTDLTGTRLTDTEVLRVDGDRAAETTAAVMTPFMNGK